jgi:DNA-binding NarL/FixJ family response regulator
LIVEDNKKLRDIIRIILTEIYGIEVKEVSSSHDAVGEFLKNKYDVVLMDTGEAYLEGEYKDNIRNVGGYSVPDLEIAFSGVNKLRSINPKTIFVGYSGHDYTRNLEYCSHFDKILFKGSFDYLEDEFIPYLRILGYDFPEKKS